MAVAPLLVSCALIEKGGLVLAARRAPHKAHGGLWEFPGGKLEPGEKAAQSLEREIMEELCLHIKVGPALPAVQHSYGAKVVRLLPFVCAWQGGQLCLHDHDLVRWCTPAQLQSLNWAGADVPVLQHYLAFRGL